MTDNNQRAREDAGVTTEKRMDFATSGRPPADLAFAPILNGVDFLDRAIDELLDGHDQRELKYAVLHLQAAAEILLKVRLQREGFEQVFEDPAQADEVRWRRGDFRSVTLSAAITRLKETAEVTLSRKECKALENLTRERNKLQHFGSTSSHLVVSNRAGKAMEVLFRFIVEHLVPEAPEDEQGPLERAQERIGHALREIASVAEARLVRVTPELEEWSGVIIHCPNCSQLGMDIRSRGRSGLLPGMRDQVVGRVWLGRRRALRREHPRRIPPPGRSRQQRVVDRHMPEMRRGGPRRCRYQRKPGRADDRVLPMRLHNHRCAGQLRRLRSHNSRS
jgi:transcriptional regulator